MTQPIFLIGARGCGKTTVGEALTRACGFAFIDTDQALQAKAQRSIAEIVEDEGWSAFRARETATLQSVTQPATVIATGGGIILSPINCDFMRNNGVVIYLNAPVSVLAERLEAFPEEAQRPTLTGKPISEEVHEVLAQRDALYRQTAHHVVDASGSPEQVVREILTALQVARAS
ncbi:shikimate kinase AroL [Trabulsiella odontotermitis]|uniref:Shikimate kinase 1 n=1 Tax=Trabulsiella odontotermitis TaxID=379893 RepID=A0A0L0H3L9_9ENTR|nr:shikimate kinase AroL [Trabulsiella odontotermitis]KNC95353.1 shikimate kinase [Trabulsiella odontotermitis]